MKNTVMILISGMAGMLILIIVLIVGGSMNRSTEAQNNLPSAMERTVERMVVEKEAASYHVPEAVAASAKSIIGGMDTDSDVMIDICQVDDGKGVLAMKLMERFLQPNGMQGTVETERTVILNKVEEEESEIYWVKFYIGDKLYKSCSVQEGDVIRAPMDPQMNGMPFTGWQDANGYLADFTQPVMQDQTYFAGVY